MRKYTYWLFPLMWMGVIFYFSSQPYEKQDIKPILENTIDFSFLDPYLNWISFTYHHSVVSVETHGINGFIEFFIRKGAHVGVFFVLVCFFYVAFKKSTHVKFATNLTVSFILTVAYAGVDEFHQGFTENRTSYLGDVFLDGFGGLLAVLLLVTIDLKKRNKKPII